MHSSADIAAKVVTTAQAEAERLEAFKALCDLAVGQFCLISPARPRRRSVSNAHLSSY